jgi:hypothetical protein
MKPASAYGDILFNDKSLRDFQKKYMILLEVPESVRKKCKILPAKIYCNKNIKQPLLNVLQELATTGLIKEIKSYDGCFNPRYIRGLEFKKILSNHAYGVALDFNASDNPLGKTRLQNTNEGKHPWSQDFINAWRKHGWTNGYEWTRSDGMHFEIGDVDV